MLLCYLSSVCLRLPLGRTRSLERWCLIAILCHMICEYIHIVPYLVSFSHSGSWILLPQVSDKKAEGQRLNCLLRVPRPARQSRTESLAPDLVLFQVHNTFLKVASKTTFLLEKLQTSIRRLSLSAQWGLGQMTQNVPPGLVLRQEPSAHHPHPAP